MRALFWTRHGPGDMDIPDSYPPTVEIPTFNAVISRRGDRWTNVTTRMFHRQLFAAPIEGADFAEWSTFPGARILETHDRRMPDAAPRLTLLLPIYTEWEPLWKAAR